MAKKAGSTCCDDRNSRKNKFGKYAERIVIGGVTALSGGDFHTLFLKNDGSLWAMGSDNFGQLGDGSTQNGPYQTNRPEMILSGVVTAITAGEAHSLLLKSDGSLWAMG